MQKKIDPAAKINAQLITEIIDAAKKTFN